MGNSSQLIIGKTCQIIQTRPNKRKEIQSGGTFVQLHLGMPADIIHIHIMLKIFIIETMVGAPLWVT